MSAICFPLMMLKLDKETSVESVEYKSAHWE